MLNYIFICPVKAKKFIILQTRLSKNYDCRWSEKVTVINQTKILISQTKQKKKKKIIYKNTSSEAANETLEKIAKQNFCLGV